MDLTQRLAAGWPSSPVVRAASDSRPHAECGLKASIVIGDIDPKTGADVAGSWAEPLSK